MNAGPSASTSASARPELDVVGSAGIFGNFFPQTFPHPKKKRNHFLVPQHTHTQRRVFFFVADVVDVVVVVVVVVVVAAAN